MGPVPPIDFLKLRALPLKVIFWRLRVKYRGTGVLSMYEAEFNFQHTQAQNMLQLCINKHYMVILFRQKYVVTNSCTYL